MFPLAFIAGWLQGHWWGFISRNYVVWPTFLLMNAFIALKGSHFWYLLNKKFGSASIDWLKRYDAVDRFRSILYILLAVLGLSDLESRVKVTGPYFQGHWTIKVTETESAFAHLSVVRFHRLVHFMECRQDATPSMTEGSTSKTMLSSSPLLDRWNFHIRPI